MTTVTAGLAKLSLIGRRIEGWISVPVVSIKLNDNVCAGDYGIYREPAIDEHLRLNRQTKR